MNNIAEMQSEIRGVPEMLKARLLLLDSCDTMTIFRHKDVYIEVHRNDENEHHFDVRVIKTVNNKRVLITELIIPDFLNKHDVANVCGCNLFVALVHACRTVIIMS
jgi:hypothetical protein